MSKVTIWVRLKGVVDKVHVSEKADVSDLKQALLDKFHNALAGLDVTNFHLVWEPAADEFDSVVGKKRFLFSDYTLEELGMNERSTSRRHGSLVVVVLDDERMVSRRNVRNKPFIELECTPKNSCFSESESTSVQNTPTDFFQSLSHEISYLDLDQFMSLDVEFVKPTFPKEGEPEFQKKWYKFCEANLNHESRRGHIYKSQLIKRKIDIVHRKKTEKKSWKEQEILFIGEVKKPFENIDTNDFKGHIVEYCKLLLSSTPNRIFILAYLTNGNDFMFFKVTRNRTYISDVVDKHVGYQILYNIDALSDSLLGVLTYPGCQVGELLGIGASSLVFQVTKEGEEYALKTLIHPNDYETEMDVLLRAKVDKPKGIIVLDGDTTTEDGVYKGALIHPVGKTVTTIRRHNFHMVHNLIQGISWLHSNGFIHRDIRPQNIIETSEGMYLIDFTFSINIKEDSDTTYVKGTRRFASRNVLSDLLEAEETIYSAQSTYTIQDDLESFLFTLYILMNNQLARFMKKKETKEIQDFWNRHIFDNGNSLWRPLFEGLPQEYDETWYSNLYRNIPHVY
eukprot:TRINITY_DN3458_c0_g1_i1.p1 TRINITY_DN3458_c0_g1~~TRINITY_DN3458_c0_g1_i1.p1  ORF type:complete len:566 (+),score=110.30 TRINITY_DN3458_c0_g1_i1:23-1720(+)